MPSSVAGLLQINGHGTNCFVWSSCAMASQVVAVWRSGRTAIHRPASSRRGKFLECSRLELDQSWTFFFCFASLRCSCDDNLQHLTRWAAELMN